MCSTSAHKSCVFWSLVYFCAWDYVVILSYSSLCDQRFGLGTFPPAFCHVPAVIYQLGLQRAGLPPTLSWASAFSDLFGKGPKGFQIELGAVPACWPPERSLQEVCLMMKNLNSLDWRGKKIISNQNCRGNTLCFVFWQKTQHSHETLQMSWCLAASCLCHLLHPGNTCSSI